MHLYRIAILLSAFLPGRNIYCTGFLMTGTTVHGKRNPHETTLVTADDDILKLYSHVDDECHVEVQTRRAFFSHTASWTLWVGGMTAFQASPALASGGATAGRYTTIPIAKRRYYGRVQQAVHEFLEMGPEILKGDMTDPKIQTFFDVNGIVVVESKRKDVNGQCTKKDGDCRGREVRDSRYNDMKASMYLLANAFRTDQQKPPDRLPTVKAAKTFFREMNEMEKLVKTNPKKKDPVAVERYANALVVLDAYLDLVELPPIDSGHYDQEFDTLVGETARIT